MARCQALQAAWQSRISETLVNHSSKRHALRAAWYSDIIKTSVEPMATYQDLQAAGEVTFSKHWLCKTPHVKFCKIAYHTLLGNVAFWRRWSNRDPNVKLCRLLGEVTFSRLWSYLAPNIKRCASAAMTQCLNKYAAEVGYPSHSVMLCLRQTMHRSLPRTVWITSM